MSASCSPHQQPRVGQRCEQDAGWERRVALTAPLHVRLWACAQSVKLVGACMQRSCCVAGGRGPALAGPAGGVHAVHTQGSITSCSALRVPALHQAWCQPAGCRCGSSKRGREVVTGAWGCGRGGVAGRETCSGACNCVHCSLVQAAAGSACTRAVMSCEQADVSTMAAEAAGGARHGHHK